MYVLVKLADVVQIHPSEFHKSSIRAIEDFINLKYADKVIHQVGLCVGFHSLISASEGLIGHGTGIVNVNVDFRMIVFRPFKGEILRATIEDSNSSGIFLSMDFFDDIVVPPALLFDNTIFETDAESGEQLFIWRTDDGEGGMNEFFFDKNEKVQFRVEEEVFHDLSPQMVRPQDYDTEALDSFGRLTGPYRIFGSMMHSGLGPTLWWGGEEIADDAQDEEEAGTNDAKAKDDVEMR